MPRSRYGLRPGCKSATALAMLLVQLWALTSVVRSQEPDAFDALVEVPVPALERFEDAIQKQLLTQRASLNDLASRTDVPRLELMESFGKMGQLYFLYELNEAALACFINARILAPRDFRWHYYIGVVSTRTGETGRAIESLERAIPLRPQSIPAHIRLGLLQLDQGDADAALYLLDPEVAAVFQAYVETAVFPGQGASAEIIEACEGPDDILRLGMQAEKDSILYYHELLSHAPYAEAKELIRKIIVEEGKHLTFLHRKMVEARTEESG